MPCSEDTARKIQEAVAPVKTQEGILLRNVGTQGVSALGQVRKLLTVAHRAN